MKNAIHFKKPTIQLFCYAMLVLLLTTSCATEYIYTPPTTDTGRACAQVCNVTRSSCSLEQQQKADAAYQKCELASEVRLKKCEYNALVEYNACLRYAEDKSSCHKDRCSESLCSINTYVYICNNAYRACFQNCGGIVTIKK